MSAHLVPDDPIECSSLCQKLLVCTVEASAVSVHVGALLDHVGHSVDSMGTSMGT